MFLLLTVLLSATLEDSIYNRTLIAFSVPKLYLLYDDDCFLILKFEFISC